VLAQLRTRLTYANVMATSAVFIAIGGSSYAAIQVTGKNVKNRSLTARDIKKSSLTTREIKNASLLARDFRAGQLPAGPAGAQGPRGLAGRDGANGATHVTYRRTTGTNSTTESTATVDCDPGEVATGGGALWQISIGAKPVVSYSHPTGPDGSDPPPGAVPTSWVASITNLDTSGTTVAAIPFVVCASP
jgi:hypothetical protein